MQLAMVWIDEESITACVSEERQKLKNLSYLVRSWKAHDGVGSTILQRRKRARSLSSF